MEKIKGAITNSEAKKVSIELWTYLYKHPEISNKLEMPEHRLMELKTYFMDCPLCHKFLNYCEDCKRCPLEQAGERCGNQTSAYFNWKNATCNAERNQYALIILNIIKEWNIG